MKRHVILAVALALLMSTAAFADTIQSGLYDSLTKTWTYVITVDQPWATVTEYLRISTDPAADISMFDNIVTPVGWTFNAASLGSYTQTNVGGSGNNVTYKYLEWENTGDVWGTFTFAFRDNPLDSTELLDNLGPLPWSPDYHKYNFSAMLWNHSPYPTVTVTGRAGYHNPIVPEPGTMALVAMGMGALGLRFRRRRSK